MLKVRLYSSVCVRSCVEFQPKQSFQTNSVKRLKVVLFLQQLADIL